MKFDKYGVLLADVAPSRVAKVDPNAKSGNDAHDTRSGKFAPKPGSKPRTSAPANTNPADFARMRDAVREAARQFKGELTPENIESFINSRAANPAAVNIQQFMQLVQQQQMDDLVDILDGKNHGGVKVAAPRSYVKKVMAGLAEDDIAEIIQRLEARGVKNVPGLVIGRVEKERREVVKEKHAALQASDNWVAPEREEFLDDESPYMAFDSLEFAEFFADQIQKNTPTIEVKPEIHVTVPQKAMKVTPVRDERGIIIHTIQEPME